jgi:hypothetical protein
MAVMIDTSRAPRTPDELSSLVQAVVHALPSDELDWIEWKLDMDLGSKATQGTIARHILGMANRKPEDAQRHVQGYGYLVIGLEPGNLGGITAVDPSQLGLGVQPYLGSEGPTWSPHYVQEDSHTVLVITVEPPQVGHHIFTLQKDFSFPTLKGDRKTYLAGTIFIRYPGRTEIARPGDIRALEERYAAPAQAAEAHARETLEIAMARQAAENLDRRRRWLTDLSGLVASVMFRVTPYRDSQGPFRCPEQIEIQTMLAGIDATELEADWPAVKALAAAGQGMEVSAAAARANIEIQAAMRNLTATQ